ncbi:exodeoxyribonuclease V subunit alpha [Cardiobacteriaceae bacterium TAE3-ERU3]|nr:exodeoxyribonuclease V subunit alpha [Cardiobacteriaceae bacterium TAE3-ERU3]
MKALATYWLDRLNIEDEARRSSFIFTIEQLFDSLANGDTAIFDNRLSKDMYLVIDTKRAESGAFAPVVYDDGMAWLYRSWSAEYQLASLIKARIALPSNPLPSNIDTFTDKLFPEQAAAVRHAACNHLTLINGGPGTGKTFTVARLVQLIHSSSPDTKIALAAPTGKAAKRMEESLRASIASSAETTPPLTAQTLHRLLGIGTDGTPFYHQSHHLPFDVVIIDEASMLSLDMAFMLFAAVSPQAKLILLGDADQLAAVDPGAVLHDLTHHPVMQNSLITLQRSSRFNAEAGIGKISTLLQQATLPEDLPAPFFETLNTSPDIKWISEFEQHIYQDLFEPYANYINALEKERDAQALLRIFDQYRILCASHHGPLGAKQINRAMMQLHKKIQHEPLDANVFHGMPIMITANDYRQNIFNGDIGLCLQKGQELAVFFPGMADPIPLAQINPAKWLPAYAFTIHKSQGSEYEHVAIALNKSQHLCSKELLYTGITRAKKRLSIYASETVLNGALMNPIKRSTGLGVLLNKKAPA